MSKHPLPPTLKGLAGSLMHSLAYTFSFCCCRITSTEGVAARRRMECQSLVVGAKDVAQPVCGGTYEQLLDAVHIYVEMAHVAA